MALHVVFEAVLEPNEDETGIDQLKERLVTEMEKSGRVIVLLFQQNDTHPVENEGEQSGA